MTADLSALIARLEAAEAGSRELDALIAKAFGWHRVEPRFARNKHGGWIAPEDFIGLYSDGSPKLDSLHGTDIHRDPSRLTQSLDAADALAERVFPDGRWMVERTHQGTGWAMFQPGEFAKVRAMVDASTPALALCIATLRAKLDGYAAEGEVNKTPKAQEG